MIRYYNPFKELDAIRREVDRIFTDYSGGGFGNAIGRAFRSTAQVNVFDETDDVAVEVLLPGVDPKALDISVLRNELTIAGERPADESVKPEAWHRQERPVGKFVRKVALPSEVDPAHVSAEYRDGVLKIRMAKSEAAKPRRIDVAVA